MDSIIFIRQSVKLVCFYSLTEKIAFFSVYFGFRLHSLFLLLCCIPLPKLAVGIASLLKNCPKYGQILRIRYPKSSVNLDISATALSPEGLVSPTIITDRRQSIKIRSQRCSLLSNVTIALTNSLGSTGFAR